MQENMCRNSEKRSFPSIVLGIYVLLVGIGVPLVVRDRYFDILVFKYYYYCACTITMIAILLVYALTAGRTNTEIYLKEFRIKKFLKKLTIMDYAAIIFLLIAVTSTVTSDYLFEAFWGNEGRFTGLFLIIWYVISYFYVSRIWKFKSWYIDLILVAGMLVCLFGITDYFKLDIFHFKIVMLQEQRSIFTSTIGNINTYTAYVGILAAIATVLFATDEKIKNMLWHYFCMVISFFAIIMGVSDNAYLSLGALFGFLPLYLFKSRKGIQRFVIVLATFFSVIQCIDWINGYFREGVLGIESAFDMIIKFQGLPYLIIGLWAIVIFWYFFDYKRKYVVKQMGDLFRNLWMTFLLLVILIFLYTLYDCNVLGNVSRYGSLSSYLLFNDDWGTQRGYIWRNGMECYGRLSFWKKVIGFGPETFGILIMRKTANNPYNLLFDNAHNEYLHILTTVGLAGLISYLSFIFGYIRDCLQYKNKNPYIMAIMFGVICYSAQAFVNINLPIVAPVFWLLLGMGAAKSIEE